MGKLLTVFFDDRIWERFGRYAELEKFVLANADNDLGDIKLGDLETVVGNIFLRISALLNFYRKSNMMNM